MIIEQEPNHIEIKVEPFSSNYWFQVYQNIKPRWWEFWKKKKRILVMESQSSKPPFSFTLRPKKEI